MGVSRRYGWLVTPTALATTGIIVLVALVGIVTGSSRIAGAFALSSTALVMASKVWSWIKRQRKMNTGQDLFDASYKEASHRLRSLLVTESELHSAELILTPMNVSAPQDEAGHFASILGREPSTVFRLPDLARLMAHRNAGRLIIRGRAGSGKTVTLTQLCLQMLEIQQETSSSGLPPPVPVLVSIAGWTTGERLEEWLVKQLMTEYDQSRHDAEDYVRRRRVLPLLDGLDELDPPISSGGLSRSRSSAFLAALGDWYDYATPASIVMTCRTDQEVQLERALLGLRNTMQVQIQDLEPSEIVAYVNGYLAAEAVLTSWREVLSRIESPEGAAIVRVLSAPWRLFLAVRVSKADGLEPSEQRWPRALLLQPGEETDAAVSRLERDLLSGYVSASVKLTPWHGEQEVPPVKDDLWAEKIEQRSARVQRWLRSLAILLERQVVSSNKGSDSRVINSTDLVPHMLWLASGARRVRVVHAAVGLIAFFAVFSAVSALLGQPLSLQPWPFTGIETAALLAALAFVGRVVWGYPWPRIHIGIRPHAKLSPIAISGWLWNGIQDFSHEEGFVGELQRIVFFVRFQNWAKAKAAVRRRRESARWHSSVDIGSPMDALRAYPRYIFSLAIIVAILMSLPIVVGTIVEVGFSYFSSPRRPHFTVATWGVDFARVGIELLAIVSFIFVLMAGIGLVWLSTTAWARYVLGVALGACRPHGRLPVRLGRFLDWACMAGILRRAGATYQFRHRELQEWLARDE